MCVMATGRKISSSESFLLSLLIIGFIATINSNDVDEDLRDAVATGETLFLYFNKLYYEIRREHDTVNVI